MGEESGNAVDEIASLTLTAFGSPTYEVSDTDYTPGITIPAGSGFYNESAQAALDVGTGDFNILWAGKKSALGETREMIASTLGSWEGYDLYWTNSSFPRILFKIYLSQFDSFTCQWNTGTTQGIPGDSTVHVYELIADRDGNIDLEIDTVSQGPCDFSGAAAKDYAAGAMRLGTDDNAGGDSYNGTLYYYRQRNTL
jgi:hypothetical protein